MSQKYSDRINTLNRLVKLGEGERVTNAGGAFARGLDVNKGLLEMFKLLGLNGTSSDESPVEDDAVSDLEDVLNPTYLAWRRDLETEIHYINHQKKAARKANPRGRPQLKKTRKFLVVSAREAVPHLPVSFYREEWIGELPQAYIYEVLQPKLGGFQWHGINEE